MRSLFASSMNMLSMPPSRAMLRRERKWRMMAATMPGMADVGDGTDAVKEAQ